MRKNKRPELSQVVEDIYDAALDSARWRDIIGPARWRPRRRPCPQRLSKQGDEIFPILKSIVVREDPAATSAAA